MRTCRGASLSPMVALALLLTVLPAARAPRAAEATWSTASTFASPPGRFGHSTVLDPTRDRFVVCDGSPGIGLAMLSDLWTLSGAGDWAPLDAAGTPPTARYTQSAVYDAARDRMVMFGGDPGFGVPFLNDTWALSFAAGTPTWTQIQPTGALPDGRSAQVMVLDPMRDRLVVFGGQMRDGTVLGDVWALPLSGSAAWAQLAPSGAGPSLAFHSGIYDPVRDRLLVYGGFDASGTESAKVWAFDFATATWSQVVTAGFVPSARYGAAADYDAAHDAMWVFGGTHRGGYVADVMTLALNRPTPAWTLRTPGGLRLPGTSSPTLTMDGTRNRLVAIGGIVLPGSYRTSNLALGLELGPPLVWDYALAQPTPREGMATGVDPAHSTMYAFGGYDGRWTTNDLYAYDFASRRWSRVPPATAAVPPARWGAPGAFDTERGRLLIATGFAGDTNPAGFGRYYNDVWAFDVATRVWSQVTPSGTAPAARRGATLIYDPIADRVVLFGGFDLHGAFANDVWSLNLSGSPAWTQLTPAGAAPLPRNAAAAIYDAAGQRMVVFGGSDCCINYGDTWALTLQGDPAWSLLSSGGGPNGRTLAGAAFDPASQSLLVFGGGALPTAFNDTWELSLVGAPTWHQVSTAGTPPAGRGAMAFGFDPTLRRMVAAGGSGNLFYAPYFVDTAELEFASVGQGDGLASTPEVQSPGSPALSALVVRGGLLHFTLHAPVPGDVDVALCDVHGRTIVHERQTVTAATRSFAIATPGHLASGIYLFAARGPHWRVERKVLIAP